MSIEKIEVFDLASKKWPAYIRRVEQFISLNKIEDNLKVATLISLVGEATYKLMTDLCKPDNPAAKSFQDLVKLIGDYLEAKPSDIEERNVFRLRRQRSDESLSEYLQALIHLASTCNFKSNLEENLRDQFVFGLISDDMRSRLFAESDLSYRKAVELALALEAAERHPHASISTSLGESTSAAHTSASEPLHGLAANKQWRRVACQLKNVSCDVCDQTGQLQSMCGAINKKQETKMQNCLDGKSDSECEVNQLHVYAINDQAYYVQVLINGVLFKFELDTGSKLASINLECYEEYFKDMPLKKNNVSLRSYTGTLIQPLGYLLVDVALEKYKASELKLLVIKNGGPPLIGRAWLRQLNIDAVQIIREIY